MKIYKLVDKDFIEIKELSKGNTNETQHLIFCSSQELSIFQSLLNLSHATLRTMSNIDQKVMFQSFSNYDYMILHMIEWQDGQIHFFPVQVYLSHHFLIIVNDNATSLMRDYENYVTTLEEILFDFRGNILNKSVYLLFDRILSGYFSILEEIENDILNLEDRIILKLKKSHLEEIIKIKHQISKIKKYTNPMIYIGNSILLNENDLIEESMLRFFSSISDRINKLNDYINNLRYMIDQTRTVYDSQTSIILNDRAAFLAILATVFGSLTIITGIYGMNFQYMPELHWRFGYPFALALMAIISSSIYLFFKKGKWF